MSEVVVRLVGGLGNQMFQYAAARAVAIRENVPLHLDLSWFGMDPDRQFGLSPFRIEAATSVSKSFLKDSLLGRVGRRMKRRFWPSEQGLPVFTERSFLYDPAINLVRAPIFLGGYFQSEKYFQDIRSQIVAEFTVRNDPSPEAARVLELIQNTDAICLHIRRGDYVTNPQAHSYHGTCSLEYYRAGIDKVSQGLARPHCFVFSDDPQWVRDNFRPELPMSLVDIHGIEEAHEDLRLMAACQHYVIANSSLSWWGAWLAARTDKRVVAPQRWFANSDNDTRDLIPAEWHRI